MRKPGWLLSPSFCLDAISLSFNIFIHSLLFSFISWLILFIICPYLQAWQSILHSASADRWKNDPCLTLPSITSLLPSLLSSWSPSETRLTACYISSSHSNPPTPLSSWQRFFSTVHALSLSCRTSLGCNNLGWEKREGTFSTTEHLRQLEESYHHPTPFISSPPPDLCCPQLLWVHHSTDSLRPHTFYSSTWPLHADIGHGTLRKFWTVDDYSVRQSEFKAKTSKYTALQFPPPSLHLDRCICFWWEPCSSSLTNQKQVHPLSGNDVTCPHYLSTQHAWVA